MGPQSTCDGGCPDGIRECSEGQTSSPAALIVFLINMAMVIGPTPPGTGVIQEARSEAPFSTSPTSLLPLLFLSCFAHINDDRTTLHPVGFDHTWPPTAATIVSESSDKAPEGPSSENGKWLPWHQLPFEQEQRRGIPTHLDLPTTRAFLPASLSPVDSSM